MSHSQPATGKQLAYLRTLADQTGTTFLRPRDRRHASREIERLRRLKGVRGNHVEAAGPPAAAYGTAPHAEEVTGWGSTARWTTTKPRGHAEATRSPAEPPPGRSHREPEKNANAHRLGGYVDPRSGRAREIVQRPDARGGMLVLDLLQDWTDARLVGRIGPDEPRENARILARLYLHDPNRGRCMALTTQDVQEARADDPPAAGVRWDLPLPAGIGEILQLKPVATDGQGAAVRWTRSSITPPAPLKVVSLRDVVGCLEDYEPALTLTAAAIRHHDQRTNMSVCLLRGELSRMHASPLVLNRRLREHLQRVVSTGELTMSEIAIRCGRVKRDRRGNESGETSWLARRIGQLPEAGKPRATPWVHTDVLALIAREGLGISPREVELPTDDE